nr:choline kinase [Theileria orientalis]
MPEYNDFPGTNGDESERSKLTDEELKRQGSNYANRVLFCHNDLHLKNLIATYDGLTLIDFEYSSFNYVGADIGFFFVESNFDYDCQEYPFFKMDRSFELSYDLKVMFASVYLSESLRSNVLPDRTDIIDPFLNSIELFSMGTLLFWAYWGIIMLSLNDINSKFDYKQYSQLKFELFAEKFAEFKSAM